MDHFKTGRSNGLDLIMRIGTFVLCMLLASSSLSVPISALAEEKSIEEIGNGFIEVYIDPSSGRFVIQTDEGNPGRDHDSQKELLFGEKNPKTSFTTFRIDDHDYIFGNSYGFLGLGSSFVVPATTVGSVNQSKWKVDGIEITQTITLMDDETNPNAGNVRISYLVDNQSGKTRKIGSRILLDTKLGPEDASPITLEGENSFIQHETELSGELPQYWRASDDTLTPDVISYGFLSGWNNIAPDRMIVGHWEGMSATKWDYEANRTLNFTNDRNKYGTADSAVAIYWDTETFAPGETRVYETYYGLGDFQSGDQTTFDTLLTGPHELTVNDKKDGYNEETFQISLLIDNTLSDAVVLDDVVVELGLPAQLQLAEGEQAAKTFTKIEVNETKTITWNVQPEPQANFEVPRYLARVRAKGTEETITANYVILPATSGAPPEVQVMDMLPDMKYVGDETHELTVVGKNLSLLKGNPDVNVTFVRETDGHIYTIPSEDIKTSGNVMTISLDGLWTTSVSKHPKPGLYTLQIDGGSYGKFEKQMEYTNDESYRSLKYGILAVVSNGTSHDLKPFESEEDLEMNSQEKLLIIRGKVREFSDTYSTWYEVEKGATINSVIRFEENSSVADWLGLDQKITVKKNDAEDVVLTGAGALSIPSFPFALGEFSITLEDGTDYTLDTEEESGRIEIVWPLMSWQESEQNLNSMPVKIESAKLGKIGNNHTVSFGGKLTMNLGGQQKSVGAETPPTETGDEAGINVALEEARFGITKNGQFGLQGIDANGEVALPEDFIPGMTFGAEASMEFNTFIKKYGVSVAVEFEVIELNGTLVLRLTDQDIPVIDKLEFAIGADELGLPLVPPTVVGEITKAGGGFDNLYDTIMGNYEVLPPLKLTLIGSMELAEVIEANDMRLDMSLQGTSFTGSLDILKVPILKSVYGNIIVKDAREVGVDVNIGAKLRVLEIINGNAELAFSYDETREGIFGPVYLAGRGNVAIVIPAETPIIGGAEIAGAQAEISTEQLMAQLRVLEIPVGVSYVWGGNVEFLASNQDFIPKSFLMNQPLFDPETGEYLGQINFGTNIQKITSGTLKSTVASLDDVFIFKLLAGVNRYDLTISDVDDHMFLELPLTSSSIPDVTIAGPSGTLELKENENYLIRTVSSDESASGVAEHYMVIAVKVPQKGNWTITTSEPLKGDPVAYSVTALPEIHHVTATSSENNVTVTWDLSNTEDGKEVALYLTTDNGVPDPDSTESIESSDIHVLGPAGVNANDHTATFSIPETLPSGEYFVKAVLADGDTNLHSAYSAHSISITNENEPRQPEKVQASSIGSGILKIDWTYGETELNGGFAIQALDENGDSLPGVGPVIVDDASQRTVNIGGVFTNTKTGEEFGLFPDKHYKIAVTAFNLVNGKKVYGGSTVSDLTYIPEPDPATVRLSIPDGQAKEILDERGNLVYFTAHDSVDLQVDANQDIEADLYVDGKYLSTHAGTSISEPIFIDEGEHFIELRAMNRNGDITISTLQVRKDSVAPDLKMVSPLRSEAVSHHVEVKGIAEPGSTVTVDGEKVPVKSDGQFYKTITIDGYLTRQIEVIAEDQAGNRTVYVSEVANTDIPVFDHIEIRSDVHDVMRKVTVKKATEIMSLRIGESEQLTAVGVDESGNEFVIDDNHIDWEVVIGDHYGSISPDGTLSASAEGELFIKASYSVGSGYTYADMLRVKVKGEADEPDMPEDPVEPGDPEEPEDPEKPDPDKPDQSDSDRNPKSNKKTYHFIDEKLERTLRKLIQADKHIKFIGFKRLSEKKDIGVQMDASANLLFFKQKGLDKIGVGYGIVRNPEHYRSDSLEFVSDVYEIKLSEPVNFDKSPILSIHVPYHETINVNRLKIYWYNEEEEHWEKVGGTYDPASRTISVELSHFSKYALLYNKERPFINNIFDLWTQYTLDYLYSRGVINSRVLKEEWLFSSIDRMIEQEMLRFSMGPFDYRPGQGLKDRLLSRDGIWVEPYIRTDRRNERLIYLEKDCTLYLASKNEITKEEATVICSYLFKNMNKADDRKILLSDEAWLYRRLVIGFLDELYGNQWRDGCDNCNFEHMLVIPGEAELFWINNLRYYFD
ncbi:MAG: hypothetical protein H0Z32_03745 [Bacillaceae bacterium]|nr:hypothetical protein [Bacillaceae bacterium]